MAKEGKTVAIIRFRPKNGPAGGYDVEFEIGGSASFHHDGFCRLPPTYEGLTLDPADGAEAEDGVIWRKAGADSAEDFRVSEVAMLEQVGAALYEAMFSDTVRGVLESQVQSGVALRFDLSRAPALAQEPFEALFLRRGGVFIGTQVKTPISRLLRADGIGSGGREVVAPARALFAAANPFEDLDQSAEIENIRNGLARVNAEQPAMDWTFREGLTRASFVAALAEVRPDIVHFLGHGQVDPETGGQFVIFHDSLNPHSPEPVPAEDFRAMLQNSSASLVMLNSCASAQTKSSDVFAGVAQGLIRNHIPFVVAMRTRISDEAALLFSSRFYAELARFRTPEAAVTLARSDIRTIPSNPRRHVEFATPVLYVTGARESLFAAGAAVPEGAPPPEPPPGRGIIKWVFLGLGGLAVIGLGLFLVLGSGGSFQGASNASNAAPPADANAMAMNEMSMDMNAAAPTVGSMSAAPSYETASPDMAEMAGPDMAEMAGPEISGTAAPARRLRRRARRGAWTDTSGPAPTWYYEQADQPAAAPPCPEGWSRDANGVCVAAPPPSPPPPETRACPSGAVILATEDCPAPSQAASSFVFFDWDKDEISPAAAAILDNAATAYAQTGGGPVTITGHTDRSGASAYNAGLSQRRADAVRAYLASRGIPEARISTEAFGESRPLVDTADGVREPQNRRVEISFGPAGPADP